MLRTPNVPDTNNTFLIVEASSDAGAMAVLRGADILASADIAMGRGQDDLLTPALAPLLARTGLAMRDLRGIVCGEGPGSFTSLRIAAAFAKGLAFGLDVPLFAVPSLALVSAHHDRALATGAYCVFADALRDECYAQLIDVTPDGLIGLAGDVVRVHTRDLAEFANGRTLVRSNANSDTHPRASLVPLLRDWRASGPVVLDSWEPAYGRLAEAQVKWEAAHGRALE